MTKKRFRTAGLAIALLYTALYGCATNPVTGESDFVLMSEEQEIQLGRQSHEQIMKQYQTYDDPALQAYVNRLGEELATRSHRDNLIFRFTVLDSPMVNAFALPGGYIYITRGILAYMNSEAHLAGVLGHEIGHVTARHSVRQHSTSTVLGVLSAVAAAGTGSQAVGDLSSMAGNALVSGYGRGMELEADRLGAEYLARTGYDPEDMIGVVGILKAQEQFELQRAREEQRNPRVYHGLFASHPQNDQRLQEVVKAANRFKDSAQRKPGDNDEFLRHIHGLVYGPGESQGVIRGNRFYHKKLDFTVEFPDRWRIENSPKALLAYSPANDSVVQLSLEDLNRRESPEEFLRSKFSDLKQGQSFSADGYQAYSGLTTKLNTPFGRRPTRVAAVFASKRAFVLVGASKSGVITEPFTNTVRSFRRLRSDEQELAKSRNLRVITARPGDTFEKLAARSKLGSYAEEQLRLLNGKYPQGEPTPGQPIKIVE
ncbi:MAG: M48 family metalloprotease [Gammaproteobacteria bacterium]|nr:M48 family metalloprotease [Gammaproteobacteria bacterium]